MLLKYNEAEERIFVPGPHDNAQTLMWTVSIGDTSSRAERIGWLIDELTE